MIGLNELNIRKNDILYNKYNISAIYGIYVNNELVYIGSSVHCMKRFLQHKYKIFLQENKRYKFQGDYRLLYQELRKDYKNNKIITFDIIQEENNVKKLRLLERKYLQELHPKFNIKSY